MPRQPANPKLPAIAVEDETVKKSIAISRELDAEIARYGDYFLDATGKKPRSHDDVITGLLSAYLSQDAGYQKWKRETSGQKAKNQDAGKANGAGNGSFAAKDSGAPADNGQLAAAN